MSHSLRPTAIIGNWKMNKTIAEAKTYVFELTPLMRHSRKYVGLAVPFTMIASAAEAAKGTSIAIGAQNASDAEEGAFTGEISSSMVKEAGASFVILGHSERRQLFHENNALINRKLFRALAADLKVVLCIGETKEERDKGETEKVLCNQLSGCLEGVTALQMANLMIAYEPVWAIGTGKVATPESVQVVHHFCRDQIASQWGQHTAEHQIIQYGGSVKPENAAALLEQPDVDGLLIGGASLSLASFSKFIDLK